MQLVSAVNYCLKINQCYTYINEKLLQERAMLQKRENIIWIAKESSLHDQMKLHQIQ